MAQKPGDGLVREVLTDAFGRVDELVRTVTDRLSTQALTYRVDPHANTIAWLVWHSTRVQDDHVADAAGAGQAWVELGWHERFGLPLPAEAIGYGHSSDEVAVVTAEPQLLAGYHQDVHRRTLSYLERLDGDELHRVLDDSWDPPVTVGVRLVSVVSDCLQHLGQASYVRGVVERLQT